MPETIGGALSIAGVTIVAVYLVGFLLACVLWVRLWRRYGDVTVAGFSFILVLSLTSWVGVLVSFFYLYGRRVMFAKTGAGPSQVEQPGGDAPAGT